MTNPWETPPVGQAAVAKDRVAAALPRVATPRTILRAPYLEDFDTYAAIVGSDRGRFVGGPMDRKTAWADFNQVIAGWVLRGAGLWTVERQSDGAILGFVMLIHEYGAPEAELGFLFTAEAEGQGYAHEAARSARNNAFNALSWETLVSYITPDNARAIRLAQSLGATHDPAADHDGAQAWRYPRPEFEL